MAINPATTLPIFQAGLTANGLVGTGATQLSDGLSSGLFTYITTGVTVISIDAGTLGVGTGVGIGIVLSESVVLQVLVPFMAGEGIFGIMSFPLANAIAFGVSSSLILGQISTINPLVGVGAGKVQLIPNGSGAAIFESCFKAAGLAGASASNLATAVGSALDTVIAFAVGVVAIVGVPSIIGSAGVGSGTIK